MLLTRESPILKTQWEKLRQTCIYTEESPKDTAGSTRYPWDWRFWGGKRKGWGGPQQSWVSQSEPLAPSPPLPFLLVSTGSAIQTGAWMLRLPDSQVTQFVPSRHIPLPSSGSTPFFFFSVDTMFFSPIFLFWSPFAWREMNILIFIVKHISLKTNFEI